MKLEAPVWRHDSVATGPTLIGMLSHETEQQRWQFVFDSDYLKVDNALELDPHWCRRLSRSPLKHDGASPPGAFADVALSGWTFDMARRALPEHRQWTWWDRLVLAPDDGFGALSVGDPASKPNLKSAFILEAVQQTPELLRSLSNDSSSGAFGGERPKIAIQADGREWLLKFPAPGDPVDIAIAEATALTLAMQCGLNVPSHYVVQLGVDTLPALLIERFDRNMGSRIQAVSAATALGLGINTDVDSPKRSYRHLRSVLREPNDAIELFKRIVFNAVVHNGDDHPWNQSLIQIGRGRWALSPLYDVTPFVQAQHPCVHRMDLISAPYARVPRGQSQAAPLRRISDMKTLGIAGDQIARLSTQECRAIIEQISTHVVENWQKVFADHASKKQEGAGLIQGANRWAKSFEGFAHLLA